MESPLRSRLLAPAFALLLATAALAPAAQARVRAELRVEGPKVTLDPGHRYRTGTERITLATRSDCSSKHRRVRVSGPTALGIVQSAIAAGSEVSGRLRPLRVSTFPSVPGSYFACRIGDFSSDPGYWLYRVNHVAPSVGANQYRLHRRDQVLWYYADFTRHINTGDELALRAPRRATAGEPFTVRAFAYDDAGERSPAAGVKVRGGDATVVTGAGGRAQVTVSSPGKARLVAVHRPDIPANRERVKVR